MIEILFEDQDLVVITKPAGMVVNEAASVEGQTVQAWWMDYLKKQKVNEWQSLLPGDFDSQYGTPEEIFKSRGGIVHRLDKDTSGALLLAKNPGVLCALLADFKKRRVQKIYQCLVYGKLKSNEDTIELPLARNPLNRQKIQVNLFGRPAKTVYKVVKLYRLPSSFDKNQDVLSFLECRPMTGRMHQIRVHLAHIGHPLVSDWKYAGRKRTRRDRTWCARHFLHAFCLEFFHPRTKQKIVITSPLPEDLLGALDFLSPG